MLTKQEWREKAIKWENGQEKGILTLDQAREQVIDFFYSLHLQELSKIMEKIKRMKKVTQYGEHNVKNDAGEVIAIATRPLTYKDISYNKALDDILLAITDEK